MKTTVASCFIFLFVFANAVIAQKKNAIYDIVVATDGSGNYTKIQEAFDAVPENNSKQIVIFIKPGIYKEKLILAAAKKNVKLVGESYQNTILTYDDYAEIAGGTKKSFSVCIEADDFTAENITFENTIDSQLPQYQKGGQAVALMVMGDRGVFHLCKITGFQDTFYLKDNKRTYIKDCIIDGTTDFIFGAGIALFENCFISSRKDSYITASNQEIGKSKYGFVFKDCVFMTYPKETVTNVSFGRPWGAGANVVLVHSYEGPQIAADGWSVWSKDPSHKAFDNWKTTFYAEYDCFGPGYLPKKRLSWTHQLTKEEASMYTKAKIFAANTTTAVPLEGDWNPVIEKDNCRSILPSKKAKNAVANYQKGF
nr:pectinesterase family protein [uncultured Flavobacterium sp.]